MVHHDTHWNSFAKTRMQSIKADQGAPPVRAHSSDGVEPLQGGSKPLVQGVQQGEDKRSAAVASNAGKKHTAVTKVSFEGLYLWLCTCASITAAAATVMANHR